MRIFYLITLLLLFHIRLNAQQFAPPLSNLPTPNSAAVGIFGQYPQAQFTGVPTINVPIYDFNYNGLSLPLVLKYNNNGVKPDSYGSWVGMGWSLTSGGTINRVINGKADDLNYHNIWLQTNQTNNGYFYNHGYLSDGNWASFSRLEDAFLDYFTFVREKSKYPDIFNLKDYSPDEFSFNVGELSGSFYMDDQGNWKVKSNSKVKIDPISNSDYAEVPGARFPAFGDYPEIIFPNFRYLNKITLTDTRGIKFIFGGVTSALEMKGGAVDTWNLTSIIFPNGKTLTYYYDVDQSVSMFQPRGYNDQDPSDRITTQTVNPVYLRSISSDSHHIQFSRSLGAESFAKLDSISISNRSGHLIKKIAFSYNINAILQLKLMGLTFKNSENTATSNYSFNYNELNFNYSPHRFNYRNTDHLGYNNSKALNASSYSTFKASKDADTAASRAELLKSIIYPTGGYTQFTWEPNDFSKEVPEIRTNSLINYSTNQYTGGVRIKQITNYDANHTILSKKRYAYISNYTPTNLLMKSSGVLYGKPKYRYYNKNLYYYAPSGALLENNVGSHVSYSEVAEINEDDSYNIITFSNFDTGINNEYMDEAAILNTGLANTIVPEYISNSHERGFPLEERMFTSNGITIREKITKYQRLNKSNDFVRAYRGELLPNLTIYSDNLWWWGSAVKIYTNSYVPKTVTETLYGTDGVNAVTTANTYFYDETYRQVRKMTSTNSKGDVEEAIYNYPYDMVSQNRDPAGIYNAMVSKNVLSSTVETIYKVSGTQTNLTRYDYIQMSSLFLPGTEVSQIGANAVKTTATYQYDHLGNLIKISPYNTQSSAYTYGYGGKLLISKTSNASPNEILHENFEETGTYGLAHTGNYFNEGSYSVNFVIPNGRAYTLRYWYRINNEWKFIVQTYTAPVVILPAGADAIDDVSVYPSDAEVTTYTHNQLVGITSSVDSRGQTTTYEYDASQRLAIIYDNDGNITKYICYNYAGQASECTPSAFYYNDEQNNTLTRNNCDIGYESGDQISYTVPSGKYMSRLSKAAANAKASAELEANGQAKANSLGVCTIIPPPTFDLTYTIDNYLAAVSITVNRTSGTQRALVKIRIRHDTLQNSSLLVDDIVEVQFEQNEPSASTYFIVNAATTIEVELLEIIPN